MKQKEIMLESEADAWLERNRDQLGQSDLVSEAIEAYGIRPQNVLEVGCSNGWRLAGLRARYGCNVLGIEPGRQACMEAAENRVPAHQSTASSLPVSPQSFDVVIYGFCLYLTDPEDWLRIAAEGDTVLQPGGHLIIHDFAETAHPFARRYKHRGGLLAYHVSFSHLWLAHPLYALVHRSFHVDDEMITILKKRPVNTIEVRP